MFNSSHKTSKGAILLCLFLTGMGLGFAQEAPPQGNGISVLTPEMVQARLDQVNADATLADDQKKLAAEMLGQALELATSAQALGRQAGEQAALVKDAPQQLAALEKELSTTAPPVSVPENASVSDLDHLLSLTQQDLASVKSKKQQLQAAQFSRVERRRQLPQLLVDARRRFAELDATGTNAAGPEEAPVLVESRRLLNEARRKSVLAEIASLEAEQASYEARGEMLSLQLEKIQRDEGRLDREIDLLRQAAMEAREAAALKAWDEVQERMLEATAKEPLLRKDAEKIAGASRALVLERIGKDGILRRIARAQVLLEEIEQQYTTVTNDFVSVQRRADAAGLNEAVGALLRRQRISLPDVRDHQLNVDLRAIEIADVQIRQLELNEDLGNLGDIEGRLDELIGVLPGPLSEDEAARYRDILRPLVQGKRDNLTDLLRTYDTYFEDLFDLDYTERALIAQAQAFQGYIDERVLWIRSIRPFSFGQLKYTIEPLVWLAAPQNWISVGLTFWADMRRLPLLYVSLLLLFGLVIALRFRAAPHLETLGGIAEKSNHTHFITTLKTLVITLYLVLPSLILLLFLAWRTTATMVSYDFPPVFGAALWPATWVAAGLLLLKWILHPCGLATAHFGWPKKPVRILRRYSQLLLAILAPAVFVVSMLNAADDRWIESLARPVVMLALLVVLGVGHLIMRPKKGLWATARNLQHVAPSRLQFLLYGVTVTTPLILFVLTAMGYYYTVLRISERLELTVAVVGAILLGRALALRWLLLSRRRIAMAQAKKAREARKALAEGAKEAVIEDEAERLDIARIDIQTSRLVQGAAWLSLGLTLWFIWINELPALNVLDTVELWPGTSDTQIVQTGLGTGVAASLTAQSEAPAAAVSDAGSKPITLGDLVVALLIAILAWLAAVNIPGLLEIIVLQRLRLAAGERYAIITIVRYVVTVVGIVMVAGQIGLGWSKVQWLVAALGVGLGFGLQEIFANFISGLIMLFERPIRVGDTVTVGGLTGTVSKIRIRATYITDFDRKEIVVPNKEFVTAQLVNWTLSDPVIRVIVNIGIAYGSNTELAMRIFAQAARQNPKVMSDPPPQVLFLGFGDSSLNFEVRVHCAFENFIVTRHELHMAIDKACRETGIVIAFPQRDIHIRSIDGVLPIEDKRAPRKPSEDDGDGGPPEAS